MNVELQTDINDRKNNWKRRVWSGVPSTARNNGCGTIDIISYPVLNYHQKTLTEEQKQKQTKGGQKTGDRK